MENIKMEKTLRYIPPKWGVYKSHESDNDIYPFYIEDKECRSSIAKIPINCGYEQGNAEIIVRSVNAYEGLIAEIAVKDAVIKQLTEKNNELVAIAKEVQEAIKRGGDLQLGEKGRNATLENRIIKSL